jgi:hypothetical protein
MANISVKIDGRGLLHYAQQGREAVRKIKKAIGRALNVGRKEVRQQIGTQFTVRTGFLRRQARRVQTRTTLTQADIKGKVSPIPRLMNIFEGGATLANGRGLLRPRPVVAPAADRMEAAAIKEVNAVLAEVGK